MDNMHLVTGFLGREHIKATDQAAFNAALIGTGQFVLNKGKVLEAQVISNNQIRVLDGELMMQGRFIRLDPDTYVDLTIENGAQGMKRNDLVAVRYTKDTVTGVESANLVVIKGEAVESNPADPAYTTGDITNGQDVLHDMPLYRIPLDGLNVGELVPLFSLFGSTESALEDDDAVIFFDDSAKTNKKALWSSIKNILSSMFATKGHTHTYSDVGAAAASHKHAAGDVTSGTFGVDRGGTGKASWTANRLIYPSAATTMAQLGFPSVAGSVLRQGTSGAPYWTSLADLKTALGVSGGITKELLWTNASPTSTFSAQSISVSLNTNDLVVISAKYFNEGTGEFETTPMFFVGVVGEKTLLHCAVNYIAYRAVTISATSISFGSGTLRTALGSKESSNVGVMIPLKIYRIKGGA